MAKKTVAAVLVDTLAAAGVPRIYGLAGDSLNAITDAIRARETIQRFEQFAETLERTAVSA